VNRNVHGFQDLLSIVSSLPGHEKSAGHYFMLAGSFPQRNKQTSVFWRGTDRKKDKKTGGKEYRVDKA
jgi:hypothetical protein